jgi:hypothetical protein
MTEITLTGSIISKKNMLKLSKNGHGYYDPEVRAILNDLNDQVSRQWSATRGGAPRPPLLHPAIAVVFYVTSDRSDKDNKYTTVLDALVAGGVMKDDCIAYCNGPVLLCEAVMTPSIAGAKVFIEESGDFERLWRHVKAQDFNDYNWLKQARAERKVQKSRGLRKI